MQKCFCIFALFVIGFLICNIAIAGAQREEPLSNSVKALMQKSISDTAVPKLFFTNQIEATKWLDAMSGQFQYPATVVGTWRRYWSCTQ